jgi:hypothetical protein
MQLNTETRKVEQQKDIMLATRVINEIELLAFPSKKFLPNVISPTMMHVRVK